MYDAGSDTVGNLTQVTEDGTGPVVDYSYDALYRLTSDVKTGSGSYSKTYGYDLAGNLTSLDGSTFGTYDDANKLATVSGGSASYDGDGNLTGISGTGLSTLNFTWDSRSKLSSITDGTDTITYGYDARGLRISRDDGTDKKFYIFSGGVLLGEIDDTGAVLTVNTWGADGLAFQNIGGTLYFNHYGPQGETRKLTNSSGTVTDTYAYTAYGKALSHSGSTVSAFQYGGKYGYYTEDSYGVMLATFRWYSPELGRWLSRDPIGYEGGVNLYGYVGNNPVMFVDPSGYKPLPKDIIDLLQPYYDTDLSKVDIRDDGWNDGLPSMTALAPIDPGAITLGDDIYVRKNKFNIRRVVDLELIAHELVHVEQYNSTCSFRAKYVADYINKFFDYEKIKYEAEARDKSYDILKDLIKKNRLKIIDQRSGGYEIIPLHK